MKLYIHIINSISPQKTYGSVNITELQESKENKLFALEPSYEGIPHNVLRRMGKAVRMSVGAALPLLKDNSPDGIIIGTANGGMEDCIRFMNQIITYEEDTLAPGNFVQSTPNALAAQIALIKRNQSYNITHVHRGLAFETALCDAAMQVHEHPEQVFLLGATDEISAYNYNVERLSGWYKERVISNTSLYNDDGPASLAGEGSVMMLVSGVIKGALSEISAFAFWHSDDEEIQRLKTETFLHSHLQGNTPDWLISGENGDSRLMPYYRHTENLLSEKTGILRFKHMCGEYPTAIAQAVWLANHVIQSNQVPAHCIKKKSEHGEAETILIYNTYKGKQHSLILIKKVNSVK